MSTTIPEGWYIPEQIPNARFRRLPRWVLGEIDGIIRYSKGGNEHFCCRVQTFINWARRTNAAKGSSDKESPT